MQKEYSRTNIFVIDEDLWKWAKFRANKLGKTSVSEYLFGLIDLDKIDPTALDLENLLKTTLGEMEGISEPRAEAYNAQFNKIAIEGLQKLIDKIQKLGSKEVNQDE